MKTKKWTSREKIEVVHNIQLSFDFIRFLTKHPSMLRKIRNNATVEILPEGVPLNKRLVRNKNIQFFSAQTSYRPL